MACRYATSIGLPDPDSPCGLDPRGCSCAPTRLARRRVHSSGTTITSIPLTDEQRKALSVGPEAAKAFREYCTSCGGWCGGEMFCAKEGRVALPLAYTGKQPGRLRRLWNRIRDWRHK